MLQRHELPPILERVAAALEPELRRQLLESLVDPRERRLFDWVFDWYADPKRRRWYDPFHIVYSTLFALDLIPAENGDPLIVPAVLLHDIGYTAIADRLGTSAWRQADSRITHMQEGAAMAARVLAENGYSPGEIETVVGMVAVHDNPYLGIPLHGAARRLMRDCDRVWVMHPLSFYKDWAAKKDDDPNCDLGFFLAVRRVHFFGAPDSEAAVTWGVSQAVLERASSRIEQPFSPFAKAHIDGQFRRRRQELASGGTLSESPYFASQETFERRLSQTLLDE